MVSLIDNLCTVPSLLKITPTNTLVDFITAIALCPKIMNVLPSSTIVSLLSKIHSTDNSNVLCTLSPVVRMLLIHSVSSPEGLVTLKPIEISFLIHVFISTECVLQESQLSDLIELLKTISSSSFLMDNIPTSQVVNMLYQMSKLAPSLLCDIPINATNTLLSSIMVSIQNQSPLKLIHLTSVITSSPYMLNKIDPSILSSLLMKLSPSNIFNAIPSTEINTTKIILLKLLTNLPLRSKTIRRIEPDAIISILHSIKSTFPSIICNLSSSARFAYVVHLTTTEVTNKISIQMRVNLIDILSNTQCLFTKLPSSCIKQLITLIVSNKSLLNSIPLKNILNLIYNITVLSPSTLQEIPPDHIKQLLPLTCTASLNICLQFLSSFKYSPLLMNTILDGHVITIFTALSSNPSMFKQIPSQFFSDIFTQIFMTPKLLSKTPLNLLVNVLEKMENQMPNVVCTILPSANSAFMDFLGKNPGTLTALSSSDLTSLINVLVRIPCFLTQVSANTLTNLLDSICILSKTSNNIPIESIVKLIYNIYLVSPSIFCSLPPVTIHEIANTFQSLGSLSSNSLIELTTTISECPCILPTLDYQIVTNLIEVLSASTSTLIDLQPRVLINLMTQLSFTDILSAHSIIHFLQKLFTVAPSTFSSIPTSLSTTLLKPLNSLAQVNELTSTDFENLLDILTTTPFILAELPHAILINLLTAMSTTFTTLPSTKIISFLTSIHSVSPMLMCIVPDNVLMDLTNILNTKSEFNILPSEFVVVFTTILSSSPRLMNSIPASTLNSLLSTLSFSPEVLKRIPFNVLLNFLTKLALTPLTLKRAKLSLLISLLSALVSISGQTTCTLPSMVVHGLLIHLDIQAIYELEPMDVASLLGIAVSAPCVLNAITGPTLNTLLIRIASSTSILSHVTATLPASFLSTLASSSTALKATQPKTLVILMTTIALTHPTVLSGLSSSVAYNLMAVFKSQRVFASFPPVIINSFMSLLITFPNLLTAMPPYSLETLLCFLTSSPNILGSLPTCTLFKLLTILSSLPQSLKALSPNTLTSFIAALSKVSTKFLCILSPSVIVTLIRTITSQPALNSSTPESIASLISTLNRSRYLFRLLPFSILVSFLSYLSSHPNLLKNTPDYELISLINSVKSPDSIPQVLSSYQSFTDNKFNNLSICQSHDMTIINTNLTTYIPDKFLQNNVTGEIIYTFSSNNNHINLSDNSGTGIDNISKIILPKESKSVEMLALSKNKHSVWSNNTLTSVKLVQENRGDWPFKSEIRSVKNNPSSKISE